MGVCTGLKKPDGSLQSADIRAALKKRWANAEDKRCLQRRREDYRTELAPLQGG